MKPGAGGRSSSTAAIQRSGELSGPLDPVLIDIQLPTKPRTSRYSTASKARKSCGPIHIEHTCEVRPQQEIVKVPFEEKEHESSSMEQHPMEVR